MIDALALTTARSAPTAWNHVIVTNEVGVFRLRPRPPRTTSELGTYLALADGNPMTLARSVAVWRIAEVGRGSPATIAPRHCKSSDPRTSVEATRGGAP